jgi:MFS family permease
MKLSRDARILFVTRAVRTFAYGALAVVLALYLAARGFSDEHIGILFTLTLLGDAAMSLAVAGVADRLGRRNVLVWSCVLIVFAGAVFCFADSAALMVASATVGTISPSGAEVGPFLSIEQAAISQEVSNEERTRTFGFYQLTGSLSNAFGALTGGFLARAVQTRGYSAQSGYRAVMLLYTLLGVALALLFLGLSSRIEPTKRSDVRKGLHRSRKAMFTLSALFAIDSFGSGMVVQSLLAYWLYRRFGADTAQLGVVFFCANACAGFSALMSARIAKRVGLINTMVWTHIPGNLLLIAFPFMPTLALSVAVLLGRFLVAQMDVPARTSYVMAIVDDDERSAASALASQAKLLGASLGPLAAGLMGLSAWPFVLGGVLKIGYDLGLYRLFVRVKPPEEQ